MKIKKAKQKNEKSKPFLFCDDCKKELTQPVAETSVYVLRHGKPKLICVDCIQENDLYIWGNTTVLDGED